MQMKSIAAASAVLAVVLALASSGAHAEALTAATFDAKVSEGDWFVKFFAPWCGHCKKLAPTWEALEAKAQTADKGKHFATVDCTVEGPLCERFGIRGYPTLKVISGGKVYGYSGQRGEEELAAYLADGFKSADSEALPAAEKEAEKAEEVNEGPSDVIVLTSENFDKLVKDDKSGQPWLLEFYAPWCGYCKRLAPVYEKVATQVKGDAKVAKIDCQAYPDMGRRFGVKGFPTIMVAHGGKVYKHSGDRSAEGLAEFVKSGYASVEGTEFPGAAPFVTKDDFVQIWNLANRFVRQNALLFAGGAFVFGVVFGALLFGGSSKPKVAPAAKKNQ